MQDNGIKINLRLGYGKATAELQLSKDDHNDTMSVPLMVMQTLLPVAETVAKVVGGKRIATRKEHDHV